MGALKSDAQMRETTSRTLLHCVVNQRVIKSLSDPFLLIGPVSREQRVLFDADMRNIARHAEAWRRATASDLPGRAASVRSARLKLYLVELMLNGEQSCEARYEQLHLHSSASS